MKKIITVFLLLGLFVNISLAQDNKDKAKFEEYKPGFYKNSIMKDIRAVDEKKKPEEKKKYMKVDLSGKDLPNKVDMFSASWHFKPISQGNTGTCWCFSTLSFYESEIQRILKKEIKLSEMFITYWEYVEKAREYVKTRGESAFPEGSEANAVSRMIENYGLVTLEAYSGKDPARVFHSHKDMKKEMDVYLKYVKKNNVWDETAVLTTIKSIMNHYMGEPPVEFEYDGNKYTPMLFAKDYLKINVHDYIDVLSYKQEPYWEKVEYKVPDNWWHSEDYYNVPLEDFMRIFKESIRKGYTVSVGGDVSEAGFDRTTQCAVVPTFDIPAEYINEDSRQFRFSNRTTTDDHGMHVVGWLEKDGKDWYLVKDSSSGSRNNDEKAKEFGYYFFHEDYVKLKMMDFTVHKDMFKDYLKKFK